MNENIAREGGGFLEREISPTYVYYDVHQPTAMAHHSPTHYIRP